jgi:hypothetical protein
LTPDLETLARLFYGAPDLLGEFVQVAAEEMPDGYRYQLVHDAHMTVTVEKFHGTPVRVRVLDKRVTPTHYARKILLERESDGRVVQFGIMRVDFACVSPEVREEVLGEAAPLGRILIAHDVLRVIRIGALWKVEVGTDLARLFARQQPVVTYGRTATIDFGGVPAVELIEIVSPL